SSATGWYFIYKDKLYFVAGTTTGGRELWRTDGNPDSTYKLAPPISPNNSPLQNTSIFHEFNNSLYFGANFDGNGLELWKLTEHGDPASVIDIQKSVSSIYPNPGTGLFHIKTTVTNF